MKTRPQALAGVVVVMVSLACAPASQQLSVLALDEMRFDPPAFSIPAGHTVRLTLKNQGALVHDLTVSGLPVSGGQAHAGGAGHGAGADSLSVHAQPKQDATVEFTATQKGSYEFYCAEPGHKEAGMKGTLTVQ